LIPEADLYKISDPDNACLFLLKIRLILSAPLPQNNAMHEEDVPYSDARVIFNPGGCFVFLHPIQLKKQNI
jgi:hypothetical protein